MEEKIVVTSDEELYEVLDRKPEITQYKFPTEEEYEAIKRWSEQMKKLIRDGRVHHPLQPAVLLTEFILSQKTNNPSKHFLWRDKPGLLHLTEKEEKVRKLNTKENSVISAIKNEILEYYSCEESETLMGTTEVTVITMTLILLLNDLLREMLLFTGD